jgi:hypothetical protein
MLNLTALNLVLLVSAFSLLQIPSEQGSERSDTDSREAVLISRDAENSPSEERKSAADTGIRFENYPAKTKWPAPEFTDNFSGSEPTRYIASVKLEDLLGFAPKGNHLQAKNNTILIGVKRPSYRLRGNPYVRGNIDLNMGASIFGVNNRGLVTVSYYLKSDESYSRISTTLSVVGFSYKFIIPLGGK